MTRSDDAALTAGLLPAVAANVLLSDRDGYAFRHELIREAVLEDLLPGERAQAHRRFAEALEAGPSLGSDGTAAVQVARHWLGARELQRALVAAWRAAADAGAAFAYTQRLQMLEQVLELWGQVPDATRHASTDHAGVRSSLFTLSQPYVFSSHSAHEVFPTPDHPLTTNTSSGFMPMTPHLCAAVAYRERAGPRTPRSPASPGDPPRARVAIAGIPGGAAAA